MSNEELAQTIANVLDPYKGIGSRRLEDTARAKDLHIMKVKPRYLVDQQGKKTTDFCYDVPITQRLEFWLQREPAVLAQVRSSQLAWKEAKAEPTVLRDITDGQICRCHPVVGIAARKINDGDGHLYSTAMLYYDECETVGALGAFVGVHKLGLFYWVLGDLAPETRMASHNIQLATIVLDPDITGQNRLSVGHARKLPVLEHQSEHVLNSCTLVCLCGYQMK